MSLAKVSFTGALGDVNFDNNGESKVAANVFQIRNGTAELYTVISDRQCNQMTIGGFVNERLPRIYNLQSAAVTAVLLTIEAVFIITVILILFLYYRNAPEIKATSPYLSLIMFLGCYSLFASATIETISQSFIHDGVFICNVPRWSSSLGLHIVFSPLIMRMLRVYRIFTHFGKLGKRWSDGVLFAGVLFIVGINIIFLTAVQVIGGVKSINIEMLVTPEDSFSYYEVIPVCSPPNIITLVLFECEASLFTTIIVLLAVLTRKIGRQNFKDTKKVNAFIYLDFLVFYILFPLSLIITNREIQVYLMFFLVNQTAILCQVFLFLPKCWPPFLRHIKLKYWKTAPKKQQNANIEGASVYSPQTLL